MKRNFVVRRSEKSARLLGFRTKRLIIGNCAPEGLNYCWLRTGRA